MNYTSLEHLSAERRREVDAASNLLGDGLRELLAGLYSDKAHFIYELLQNAEDARATEVSFELEPDRLVFTHDGADTFSLSDIVAITRIGSDKRNDETKIGQFGVGFKAVFSYTTRPVIHSGEYAFAIEEMFVPRPLQQHARPSRATVFTFPFDRVDKPADLAKAEVEQGLQSLNETTLLFLQNIRTIQFRLPGGIAGSLMRSEGNYPMVTITHRVGGVSDESRWLRLVGDRSLSPLIPEGRNVAAAFRVEDDVERKPGKGKQRAISVEPLKRGETCVFFPAPKEQSDLKFHIHAPFAPTPSRESIKDIPENEQLVMAIGRLIAESLPMLRDEGWLSDGLLAALPNPDDELVAPYDSIYTLIVDAFRAESLTPAIGGGFARASEMVVSPSIFRTALSAKDLAFLTRLVGDYPESPRWLPERTGRTNQFLLGLNIREFGWSELDDAFGSIESDYDEDDTESSGNRWVSWLRDKIPEQLAAFYELLGAGFESGEFESNWWIHSFDAPLIQVHMNGAPVLVPKSDAHLPTTADDASDGRVVRELAYFDDESHTRSKARRMAFYSGIGVRRWDDQALVRSRLKDYEDKTWPTDHQHFSDMRLFVAYLRSNPRDTAVFRGLFLVKVETEDGDRWANTTQVYLDAPYRRTGLSAIYGHGTKFYPLSGQYRGKVAGVDDFMLALGATSALTISRADPWRNAQYQRSWNPHGKRWTAQGSRQDWDLPEFARIVESQDAMLLRAAWDVVVQAPEHYAQAVFQLNASATPHPMRSQLVQRLDGAWILDRQGLLRTPRSMTVEDLPPGWPAPPATSLAMAIGFGAEARERDEVAQVRAERAREIGIPVALLDALDDLDATEREAAFAEFLERTRARKHFPVGASANPGRRAAIVAADADAAPAFTTEQRMRSVVVGRGDSASLARQYLREQYTDEAGLLHCQVCHGAVPFKVADEWYFEAVQFVKGRARTHHQNAIAACAGCAALYGLARSTTDTALIETLLAKTIEAETEQVILRVVLYGKRYELWFTGRHALDLQAVLRVHGAARVR